METKPGRPAELTDGRDRTIYIDSARWEKAGRIGGGAKRASEGIRQAIDNMHEGEHPGIAWWNSLNDDERRIKLTYVADIGQTPPTPAAAWTIELLDRADRAHQSK